MSLPPPEPMLTTVVVPVFNEEHRLDLGAFQRFIDREEQVRILFANDGSTDGTGALLARLCTHPSGRLRLYHLARNSGKAEAVRQGMIAALAAADAAFVGYLDADLSTPLSEIPGFQRQLQLHPEVQMILGSRVKLLGRNIQRRAVRHYLGRVFATLASLTLRIAVYDTQCGAKLLRAGPELSRILATPFASRWIFDVEMIARLARETGRRRQQLEAMMIEQPLMQWQDVPGSKVRPADFFTAAFELAGIYHRYRAYLR